MRSVYFFFKLCIILIGGVDMPINPDTHASVSVNMPKELYEQLKVLAKKNHRSVSAEICNLVEKELERAAKK
jgi:plasmid stability protein